MGHGPSRVARPTEGAAIGRTPAVPPLPPLGRLLDLVIVARATDDRRGAQVFECMLDRAVPSSLSDQGRIALNRLQGALGIPQ